ncbi:MAG: hypothetical protein DMENIID0002_15180 [Rickettsia endosymbiont of Sergentomyia squamirostris]|uniref:Uncharacterized protein n=1 Tax=Candidatus Tisiphia endosymbiont of Sergentomyia squamirostris TaxID=3113639 RepID=A0AAT9GAL2_9RICK
MECYILTIRWAAASNLIVSIYNTEFDVTSYIEFRLLKDYLEYKGVILSTITLDTVLKVAIAANLIKNGEVMTVTYRLK